MLGFAATQPPLPPISPLKSKCLSQIFLPQNPNVFSISTTLKKSQSKQFRSCAQNGNDNKNVGPPTENGDSGGDGDEKANNVRPKLRLRWTDLVLDPDPDNIVAVGLTGLLTWASVQVLWQLLVISVAILVAALKYTIVAALLVFVLITLL